MKLPNAKNAIVDINKLQGYCLNPDHPRGRHKARVFADKLGLASGNAAQLQIAIAAAALTQEATLGERDDYGQRYVLDFDMSGPKGTVMVRSSWIIRKAEDFPRFVSCYVLVKGKEKR